ncbi:MAG: sigma-70 family RNA polymerase sigma factor [Pseudomonadota bacterium]
MFKSRVSPDEEPPSPSTSEEVAAGYVERSLSQEGMRFTRVYEGYFNSLVAKLLAKFGAGPPEPEDIAQKAFAKLHARGDLDTIEHPESFIWITACNLIRSDYRAQRVRRDHAVEVAEGVFFDLCDEIGPERVLLAREQIGIVMDALAELPERRRELFLLNRVEGLTPEQAGKLHGISRSAAVRHIGLASAAMSRAMMRQSPKKWQGDAN